jgi:NitT/TauT family transport system substrate-binding protein
MKQDIGECFMQLNQKSVTTPASNNSFWQHLEQQQAYLKKRSRRQFLMIAGGCLGGAATLVGGVALFNHTNLSFSLKNVNCTNTAMATLSEDALITPKSPTVLHVCQLNTSINFFPFYVAQQQGFFTAQGLVIPKPPLMQVGTKIISALESGHYDIGNGVITDAFGWARTDASARILGSFMNGYVVDIVVSTQFEQQMQVSASSPLSAKINALRGKKIGITGPNTGTQALLIYLFRLQGLDALKDTIQISLGSNNAKALAALQAGEVDALSFFSPIGQTAQAHGIGDIFISPVRGDVPGLRGDVHGVFYARQSVINAKSQAIAAYIRAINQAEQFIQSNPAEAKVLLNKYLGLGQSISDAVYEATAADIAKSPQISQASYNVAGQFHVQAGLVSFIPSYNQLVDSNFTNSALGLNKSPCP